MAISHVHLTPDLVRAVREAADIVAIAGEHTKLRKAGRRWSGLCPIHKEKTPSFSVDAEQGLFYCFGCGAGGDAIRLHMAMSGDDFPAAIESLARRFGVPLPTVAPGRRGERSNEEPSLEAALLAAAEYFTRELERSADAKALLARRRVPAELVRRFALGYAPNGWRGLLGALSSRFPVAELEAAGLVSRPEGGGEPYDRFRHRLIFPIRDAAGRLVGFGGRTLGDDKAKYLNTAETARFRKGTLLYGLDLAKRKAREGGRLILVEGYFDLLAVAASGEEAVVASMGTALTAEQVKLAARYVEQIVVAYDGDEAGEAAARRALPLLLAERISVRRTRLPAGQDPDSLRLSAGDAALGKLLADAPDLVLLEIDRLVPPDAHREPQVRAKAAAAVTEMLKPIPDAVLRYSYGRLAADRLGVPADLLWGRLGVGKEELVAAAPTGATPPSAIRSHEEEVLSLLLDPLVAGVALAALPGPEVFLDPVCRNIFGAFRALYEREGRVPDLREVMGALSAGGADVDRLARLLLERPDGPEVGGRLQESLENLRRRWQKQRMRELASEIREAERQGDPARLGALLAEKSRLSRDLHSLQPTNRREEPT